MGVGNPNLPNNDRKVLPNKVHLTQFDESEEEENETEAQEESITESTATTISNESTTEFDEKDLQKIGVVKPNLDHRALCKNVHDLDISSLLHCLHDSLHKNRMDLSNIGVGNPKLDHSQFSLYHFLLVVNLQKNHA